MTNSRFRYLRWRCNEIRYCMNNDSGEASSRYPEEGLSQSIKSHNNDYCSQNTRCRGSNTGLGLQGRTGKRASGRVCAEAGTDGVCNTNSNEFLIGINYVAIQSPKSYIKSAWRNAKTEISHLPIATCSRRRMMVATGSCGPKALTSLGSIEGCPMCLNPEGIVNKILIGYFPLLSLWRQYSHAVIVRMIRTVAFRITLMKKNMRAGRNPSTVILEEVKRKTYLGGGIFFLVDRKSYEWRRERIDQLNPILRRA